MPILPIALQRRHAELGRIRLGVKTATANGGTRPSKLDRYRFTSPHERHIKDLAQLYGGTARQWQNGTRTEWEVISDATTIPVVVVRGGVSQWLETWSGGGCQRRCDGERDIISDSPCICATEDRDRTCKPTTRLSVMLRDLDAIGVWRLESKGWNAAAELPGLVELAQHVADLVPARLILSERVSIKDGKTSRFVVPGLDLEVSPSRLTQIVSQLAVDGPTAPAAVDGGAARAIEHAPRPDYAGHASRLTDLDEVRALWVSARDAGHLDDDVKAALTARVQELQQAAVKPAEPGPVVVPVADVEEPPGWVTPPSAATTESADDLWQSIVSEAGRLGWSTSGLAGEFEGFHGIPQAQADAGQLAEFLDHLRAQPVPA